MDQFRRQGGLQLSSQLGLDPSNLRELGQWRRPEKFEASVSFSAEQNLISDLRGKFAASYDGNFIELTTRPVKTLRPNTSHSHIQPGQVSHLTLLDPLSQAHQS